MVEDCGIRIVSEKDITQIRHPSEQEFARFLLGNHPQLEIVYEPHKLSYIDENGVERTTIPDFSIHNSRFPDNPPRYVEITLSGEAADPKARQRRVVHNAVPGARYIVLHRENLLSIARYHPDFKPYQGRKRRSVSSEEAA